MVIEKNEELQIMLDKLISKANQTDFLNDKIKYQNEEIMKLNLSLNFWRERSKSLTRRLESMNK